MNMMAPSEMREFDADILEMGVEEMRQDQIADFDENGQRLEASMSVPSLCSLAEAEGENHVIKNPNDEGNCHEDLDESPSETNSLPNETISFSLSSRPPSQRQLKINQLLPQIVEDSTTHIPHPEDDIIFDDNQLGELPELSSENYDYFIGSIREEEIIDHDALLQRNSSGRATARSDSFERRSRESAQFAEAVGESSLMLNKIIEEDSSSDFDDSEIDLPPVEDDILNIEEEELKEEFDKDVSVNVQKTVGHISNSASIELSLDAASPVTHFSSLDKNLKTESTSSVISDAKFLTTSTPASSPLEKKKVMQGLRVTSISPTSPFVDWKFTRQFSSNLNCSLSARDLTSNPQNPSEEEESLGYRGIRSCLLEITERGVSRGNYAKLHRKAWLEVSDKHHRYGKNLRLYYKHWESLGHPYHMFFDWLDSKGEAQGNPLPDLPDCPRCLLDSDTVLYITDPNISATYALYIVPDPVDGSAIIFEHETQRPVCTGKEGWIFVLRDHVMYGTQKVTSPDESALGSSKRISLLPVETQDIKLRKRFHHSSFFGGKAVASAGIFLTDDHGRLTDLWPHSGHYRPGEAHMQRALFFLQQKGVDLSTFEVDMQQIFKVCRKKSPKEKMIKIENVIESEHNNSVNHPKKAKKTDTLMNLVGLEVACFLAHKARMIEKGVFHQLHKIRKLPHESRGSAHTILKFVN